MPSPLLNAYAEQLPRIMAEESLLAAQVVAVGAGTLRRGDRSRTIHAWERQADQPRVVVRPQGRAMYDAQMAQAGIAVKRVKLNG